MIRATLVSIAVAGAPIAGYHATKPPIVKTVKAKKAKTVKMVRLKTVNICKGRAEWTCSSWVECKWVNSKKKEPYCAKRR